MRNFWKKDNIAYHWAVKSLLFAQNQNEVITRQLPYGAGLDQNLLLNIAYTHHTETETEQFPHK